MSGLDASGAHGVATGSLAGYSRGRSWYTRGFPLVGRESASRVAVTGLFVQSPVALSCGDDWLSRAARAALPRRGEWSPRAPANGTPVQHDCPPTQRKWPSRAAISGHFEPLRVALPCGTAGPPTQRERPSRAAMSGPLEPLRMALSCGTTGPPTRRKWPSRAATSDHLEPLRMALPRGTTAPPTRRKWPSRAATSDHLEPLRMALPRGTTAPPTQRKWPSRAAMSGHFEPLRMALPWDSVGPLARWWVVGPLAPSRLALSFAHHRLCRGRHLALSRTHQAPQ